MAAPAESWAGISEHLVEGQADETVAPLAGAYQDHAIGPLDRRVGGIGAQADRRAEVVFMRVDVFAAGHALEEFGRAMSQTLGLDFDPVPAIELDDVVGHQLERAIRARPLPIFADGQDAAPEGTSGVGGGDLSAGDCDHAAPAG